MSEGLAGQIKPRRLRELPRMRELCDATAALPSNLVHRISRLRITANYSIG